MLYVCHREGRIPNPIILEVDVNAALLPGTLFCDRNANAASARTATHLEGTRLDIVSRAYNTLLDEDKVFYQAEVLIRDRLPPSFITAVKEVQLRGCRGRWTLDAFATDLIHRVAQRVRSRASLQPSLFSVPEDVVGEQEKEVEC